MNVTRKFTVGLESPYQGLNFVPRRSEIRNPDGSTAFLADKVLVPDSWSQVATDIIAQKYFRKAGIPAITRAVKEKCIPPRLRRCTADKAALKNLNLCDRHVG